MRRISPGVAPDFLEPDRCDGASELADLSQPIGEAQVSHATAIVAAGFERSRPAGDEAVRGP